MADSGALAKFLSPEKAARRRLSLLILGVALTLMLTGVVLYLFRRVQDRELFLGLIAVMLGLVVGQGYILFSGRARATQPAVEEYLLADEAAVLEEDVYDVECGRCATHFRVTDHLQRPLLALCPVCGAEGIVPIHAGAHDVKMVVPPPGAPVPVPVPTIRLRCPRCQSVTGVADSGARPLRTACSGCGATIGVR